MNINLAILPPLNSPIVVGLSGGADSVALLAALRADGRRCVAVHCHFGLRGHEADRDLNHSREVALSLGAEFRSVRFDTRAEMKRRGISAEMACRDLRYAHFEQVRQSLGDDRAVIAVAHHREDNIETLLLNLMRGAGIHGVRAMLPRQGHVVRPLLECTRAEIEQYLAERGLTYVTDSTNLECDFARNRLRNVVIPALTEAFPDAAAGMARSLQNLRRCEALYNSLLPQNPTLEQIKASAEPLTLLLETLAPHGFNAAQCADVLRADSGACFTSATGERLTINRGRLIFDDAAAEAAPPRLAHRRITPAEFHPCRGHLYLDASALLGDPQWQLRPWRQGDRITPYGMRGSRLLSDVYASAKLPAALKSRRYVLTRNGEILWAVGLCASARFPVTERTTEIIEIYEEL